MQKIKTKDVVAYVALPQVLPRVRYFLSSGFAYVSFLMAQVYFMARLLPAGHPYLNPANMGRFGIRHVIAEAANNLVFSRRNIDQIVIFFVLLAGVIVLALQFILLAVSLLGGSAMAFSFFDTTNPVDDVAFQILDRIFGVPDLFCSTSVAPSAATCPATNPSAVYVTTVTVTPFQTALHELFRFYSYGLLLIGLFIFLYFILVVVLETAVSGTPFGQRFQNVWVPIRLIVAIGLLIPINYGLNSGQYITLYAAKYGSSFATTGWRDFNLAVGSHTAFGGTGPIAASAGYGSMTGGNPIGERFSLIAMPSQVDVGSLVEAMSLVHACAFAYLRLRAVALPVAVGPQIHDDYAAASTNFFIKPYLVKNPVTWMTGGTLPVPVNDSTRQLIPDTTSVTVQDAVGFYYGGDILIRFGEYLVDPLFVGPPPPTGLLGKYVDELGGVKPYCGDIRIPVRDLSSDITAPNTYGGSAYMLQFYYNAVLSMWFDDDFFKYYARRSVTLALGNTSEIHNLCTAAPAVRGPHGSNGFPPAGAGTGQCEKTDPTALWKVDRIGIWQLVLDTAVRQAWALAVSNSTKPFMETNIIDRGWGGAGIWYNKLAEINGAFMDAAMNVPVMDRYPLIMEQIRSAKLKTDSDISGLEQFRPSMKAISGKEAPNFKIEEGSDLEPVGDPLFKVYEYWNDDLKNPDLTQQVTYSNIFMDAMNLMLGTSGLGSMRGANAHLHPLAQLVAVGKGLVESAVRNMAISSASGFLGGALAAFDGHQGSAAVLSAASSMFLSTAFIGLTAGIVLFYILPFLPFLYFFFALASWIKAIFEAMVGVPLWALAHLRIDGEGLPGDAAQNGYFLILDIFIRPILTVVGLIASITIFSAQARVLNLIWDLVTVNATGFDNNDLFTSAIVADRRFERGVVDQFFFTIIYTIIVYMLATASFKLIDKIPDNILRWAGVGVSTFGDIDQDNVDSVSRYAVMGGMTIGQQSASAVQGLSSGMGTTLGKMVAGPRTPP